MPEITRRELLASGIAFSASPLLERSLWARERDSSSGELPSSRTDGLRAVAPREHLLFDFGWKFKFGHGTNPSKDLNFGYGQADFSKTGEFKFAKADFNDSDWIPVRLPHDWAVALPVVHDDSGTGDSQLRSHGYKPLGRRYPETSVGWYRREFEIAASDSGRRIWVEFDGAFRDVLVFVNGCFVGRSDNGYVPFRFDLTDFLAYGAKNYIVLRVDASFGDGWFYEGAGVYRHVWLFKTDPVSLSRWESVVRSTVDDGVATLDLSTTVENKKHTIQKVKVKWQIFDARDNLVARAETLERSVDPDKSENFHAVAKVHYPDLWSVDTPNLYSALVTVESEGKVSDGERVSFGVRTVVFTPDKGLFLNGKPLKIQGTCNHQDHAGVGAALPDRLQWLRLAVLREMGSNAVRTSHNMPTPEWVEACDRMGMMMMCETRQMSSGAEGLRQMEAMIKRYRNSPSVIIWSIGNEENQLQGPMAEQGARIGATMVRKCHQLDPTRVVSAAVNADNRRGVSDAVDVVGFNYHLDFPDSFHKDYPKRPVFGSETSSAVSTRGEYTTDWKRNVVDSYHGVYELPELWWKFYGERSWTAGGFVWTGFDYRGEPTPFGWPSVSSNFGLVDLCGFPKDYFYYYKAWWRPEPSLHLFPHWNWSGKEGTEIPVWVYSNLDEVEVFVNGKSVGSKKVPYLSHLEWKIKYEPGVIEARGSKGGQLVLIEKRETTGVPHSIRLTTPHSEIDADAEDIALLKVEVLDRHGRPVPTANDKIVFKVSGNGKLIGVGNGDPNCHESDKEPRRSVFNGLAQVIIRSTMEPGTIHVEATKEDTTGQKLIPASLIITTKPVPPRAIVPVV